MQDCCEGRGSCIGADHDEAVLKASMTIDEDAWPRIDVVPDPSDTARYVPEWAAETVYPYARR